LIYRRNLGPDKCIVIPVWLNSIQSLNSFAGKHRIDWDIVETVRYSKKGKLIIDLDLLNDIDVYDKFDCLRILQVLAINILSSYS
jgi:hypothetical protein